MTLTEFLLARIKEDELPARLCIESGDDDSHGSWFSLAGNDDSTVNIQSVVRTWHPVRVVAECEAKRRMAGDHEPYYPRDGQADLPPQCSNCREIDPGDEWNNQPWPCRTLRLLALPYADHPDYQQDWAPSPP